MRKSLSLSSCFVSSIFWFCLWLQLSPGSSQLHWRRQLFIFIFRRVPTNLSFLYSVDIMLTAQWFLRTGYSSSRGQEGPVKVLAELSILQHLRQSVRCYQSKSASWRRKPGSWVQQQEGISLPEEKRLSSSCVPTTQW